MKRNFGTIIGKCEICGINQWDLSDGKPAIWPCNIVACPYENPLSQNLGPPNDVWSMTGSGLGQIDF